MRLPSKPDPILGRVFRGYRVMKRIATGGMGAVYIGEQLSLGRRVAIKVLYKGLDEDATSIERFRREALAVARINHPNIVQVFDVFEEEGRHFMIMEYVQGESLLDRLRRHKKLDLSLSLRILLQTASALDAAHRQGIIHRDIKPGNLLLGATGQVKVTDFGIVKMTADDASLTQTGYILGTPYYLSPEQAMDGETDPRSDLYSLGATFYEMITGKRPYSGRSAAETIQLHIEGKLIPPHEVVPEIPTWVSAIVGRMLARDAVDRYPSCREMIQDVKRAVEAARKAAIRPARPDGRPRPQPARRREAPARRPAPRARRARPRFAGPAPEDAPTVERPSSRRSRITPTRPLAVQGRSSRGPVSLLEISLDPREEERLIDELIEDEIQKTFSSRPHGPGGVAVLTPTAVVAPSHRARAEKASGGRLVLQLLYLGLGFLIAGIVWKVTTYLL